MRKGFNKNAFNFSAGLKETNVNSLNHNFCFFKFKRGFQILKFKFFNNGEKCFFFFKISAYSFNNLRLSFEGYKKDLYSTLGRLCKKTN